MFYMRYDALQCTENKCSIKEMVYLYIYIYILVCRTRESESAKDEVPLSTPPVNTRGKDYLFGHFRAQTVYDDHISSGKMCHLLETLEMVPR